MSKERTRLIAVFLIPSSALYIAFFLFPALRSFYYAFFQWRGFGTEMSFVGLRNFRQLVGMDVAFDGHFPFLTISPTDSAFWLSLRNTAIFGFLGGVITFSLAFVLTMLLSSGIRGKKFFRAVIFFPNAVATVALTTLWGFIYNPRFGVLHSFFDTLGMEELAKTTWTAPDKITFSILVAMCWIWVGFYLVMLLAAVEQIPRDFFDAAKVDGANQFQMFVRVTIPLIWDVLTIAVLHFSIGALKIFEFPYVFQGREPVRDIWTVGIYTYIMGFGKRNPIYRLGYASAIGVVTQVLVVMIILIVGRMLRRETFELS